MKWETKCIKDIVTEISEGKYVLPVIQRDFVWPEEKIELLFDSVLKEHCFGSIIAIEEPEGNSPLFAFRKFVQDGKNQSKSNPTSLTTSLEKRQFFVPTSTDALTNYAMRQVNEDQAQQLLTEGKLKASEAYSQYLDKDLAARRTYAEQRREIADQNRAIMASTVIQLGQNDAARRLANNQSVQNYVMEI